jgi:nephrocystin-3
MSDSHSGSARIFLSSTFRDFGEERDILVRRVFPALRARLRERFVELVDVDLRWGITVEAAERGDVLAICLAEIDRSRPWFVGMLGDRYGWVPPADGYDAGLLEQRPWLAEHQDGASVTELEILHGVLNNRAMAGHAFFYFRDPAYAQAKGGDYLSASDEDVARLKDLKDRIRASGFPVVEDYPTPEALAQRLEADLWAALDEKYPLEDVPDAFEQEQRRHEAYAIPRLLIYLGGERYIAALDAAIAGGAQRILVEGQSGGGKSALMANWLAGHASNNPANQIHSYYLGATANATAPDALVRHLVERIKRTTGSEDEIPSDPQALYDSLPTWLAYASAHAAMHDYRWVVVLDALNNLSDMRDLRWLPSFLPERVHIAVSCLPGDVRDALSGKGDWQAILVEPLAADERQTLLRKFLSHYNKTLAPDLEARALAHPLAANPLFLRTLAEELRLFGSHEELSDRLDLYLASLTVDDLFERVLARVEQDCGVEHVQTAMEAIWASRAGLTEEEILEFTKLVPATWAPIRLALDSSLMESGGRITFAHDYLRIAISDRYMAGNNELGDENQSEEALTLRRKAHETLAKWFAKRPVDARTAEELPWQWQQARNWRQLRACLTTRQMFKAVYAERSNEELLGYWIQMEANTKANLELDYAKAIEGWDIIGLEEASPAAAFWVLDALSKFLGEAGRYNEPATSAARLALAICERTCAPDHPRVGVGLSTLANALVNKNQLEEAEPLCRRALEIIERVREPDQFDLMASINNLATILLKKEKFDEAKPLYLRALTVSEKAFGPDHQRTALAILSYANLLLTTNQFNEAERLLRHAVAINQRVLPPSDPRTATSLQNLAFSLLKMGKLEEVESLYRRVLSINEKMLPVDHPNTASILNNLGMFLLIKDLPQEAEPLFRRALAICDRALDLDHPLTATSLNNLALLLDQKNALDEAEALYRRALKIVEKSLPDGRQTGVALDNLARLLQKKNKLDEAESCYRRALAIWEKALPAVPSHILFALNRLAELIEEKGKFSEAASFYRRALAITEKECGPDDAKTATCLDNLGRMLLQSDRLNEAEPLFRRALTIYEKAMSPDHRDTVTCRNNLNYLLRSRAPVASSNFKLLEDDQFQELVSIAKQIARRSGKAQLSLLLIACALVVWENLDLPDASREKLESLARGVAITMGPADDKPSSDKMPIDGELREMIARHKSSTFAEFVTALLAATVG